MADDGDRASGVICPDFAFGKAGVEKNYIVGCRVWSSALQCGPARGTQSVLNYDE
jgi:hypothetical protein